MAFLGTTSHGQSVETTMAQLIADELGVDYEDVTVVQADTQSTPYGPGTGGSRTAVVAGGAARRAAIAVRDKALTIAAHMMEAAPEDLEVARGVVSVRGTPQRSVSLQGCGPTGVHERAGASARRSKAGWRRRSGSSRTASPRGPTPTHVCVVEIDAETLLAEDHCGTSSPRTADG